MRCTMLEKWSELKDKWWRIRAAVSVSLHIIKIQAKERAHGYILMITDSITMFSNPINKLNTGHVQWFCQEIVLPYENTPRSMHRPSYSHSCKNTLALQTQKQLPHPQGNPAERIISPCFLCCCEPWIQIKREIGVNKWIKLYILTTAFWQTFQLTWCLG